MSEDCCKVGRNLAAYDVDLDLVSMWVDEGESTRSLAETVNERFVEAALREANVRAVEGEAENYYRLLTDDDIPEVRRLEARRRLEGLGVDVERLEGDFVSHQTVYKHLTDCLDASREQSTPTVEERADTVYRLQARTERVTERTLNDLRNSGALELGEFDVGVTVRVSCSECGRIHDVGDVFETGGCRCQMDDV